MINYVSCHTNIRHACMQASPSQLAREWRVGESLYLHHSLITWGGRRALLAFSAKARTVPAQKSQSQASRFHYSRERKASSYSTYWIENTDHNNRPEIETITKWTTTLEVRKLCSCHDTLQAYTSQVSSLLMKFLIFWYFFSPLDLIWSRDEAMIWMARVECDLHSSCQLQNGWFRPWTTHQLKADRQASLVVSNLWRCTIKLIPQESSILWIMRRDPAEVFWFHRLIRMKRTMEWHKEGRNWEVLVIPMQSLNSESTALRTVQYRNRYSRKSEEIPSYLKAHKLGCCQGRMSTPVDQIHIRGETKSEKPNARLTGFQILQ